MGELTREAAPRAGGLASPGASWRLAGDVRVQVFGALFGLGTILHELEFVREVTVAGPLMEYMERWSRALPTIGRASGINLNVVRYHLDRICRSAPGGTVRLGLRSAAGADREIDDACSVPGMRWYIPAPVARECNPDCSRVIHRWTRGELP